ncbi:hypothetical protein [Tropicibacter naphthalenivorans]|uniref:Uncharacterized protein n=2 Tax=Tropicibacter naphthalenivorans TaxID=441103 RepID=A0A0P1GAM9_9RHOB|nr:hypothetical protein [Tropicibacter naphthalenivorans]CUH78536.1 hypothetical protein TRN7648_02025 [Tropicibacter naphthalenivorans]SMC80870.1 hypothetical protein SAMN04488093_104187 [Tropicibacter naphthalenivorans]
MKIILASILALFATTTLPAAQEFGEKSITDTFNISDEVRLRLLCSAAKDEGLSDEVESVAQTITSALPGMAQTFLLKALDEAVIVSPGEGFCAVIASKGGAFLPASALTAGSIYSSAVKGGKISATETDSKACNLIDKTGICWEEVKAGNDELDGVVGCFEAKLDGNILSVAVAREDIADTVGLTGKLGQSAETCAERGLGLRAQ